MTLDELAGRRVAVWGLGSEGRGVVRLLAARGAELLLVDDRADAARRAADELGPRARTVSPGQLGAAGPEVVVRSPGVSRYRAELLEAERAGALVTTAMALWLEDFADAPVLAVTGTKGKSTTAALAAAILRAGGTDVSLVGNIGVPVTDTYDAPRSDAYVVEVSSYQAADVTVTPGVCVLTSLAADHLDWHGGFDRYVRDKLRLIDAGPPGELAVNAASEEAVRRTAEHTRRMLFGPTGRVRAAVGSVVEVDGEPLVEADRLTLPGVHNLWNLCGAVAGVVLLDGVPAGDVVERALDSFEGLPSRCRTLGERGGLVFVDDALASNPFAAAASVEAFGDRELTVIVGGADRGVEPTELVAALRSHRPVPRVVVVPPEPSRFAEAMRAAGRGGPSPEVEVADGLSDAVARAIAATPKGGVVLFSPGAPTPDGEGGYAARSAVFRDAAGFAVGD